MASATSSARPYPRLPSTGGVGVHMQRPSATIVPSHAAAGNSFATTTIGIGGGGGGGSANGHHAPAATETQSLDRPRSATGRPCAGLSAYRVIRQIGRGKFGVCQLVEHIATNKQYVLKCIPLSDQSDRERVAALQEVETLKRLQQPKPHPFIVKYFESFLENESLYICMQHCSGGDLHHFLRARKATGLHLAEEVILDWLIQLLLAIRKCHETNIIHRDIKSQNIFLIPVKVAKSEPSDMATPEAASSPAAAAASSSAAESSLAAAASSSSSSSSPASPSSFSVRLGDFGISKILNSTGELAMSVVGTPYSMSPEVCENKPYSFSSDVWATGCVLYEMCVLKHAFDSNNLLGLVWKIVQESYPPIPDMYSHDLRDLVSAMLAKDPSARPTTDQILDLKFIKRRLKVQVDEKLRQRNLHLSEREKRRRSPTPPSQREESTQNVFENEMSISTYDGPDGEDDEDGEGSQSRSSMYEDEEEEEHEQDEEDDVEHSRSYTRSIVRAPAKQPSPQPQAAQAQPSPPPLRHIHIVARASSSPKALSPSHAQQQASAARLASATANAFAAAASSASSAASGSGGASTEDDDPDTADLLRSVRLGSSRRAHLAAAANEDLGLGSFSARSNSKQAVSFLSSSSGGTHSHSPHGLGLSLGLGSVSSKRLASIDTDDLELTPASPRGSAFNTGDASSQILGRATQQRKSMFEQQPRVAFASPTAGRSRAASHQLPPSAVAFSPNSASPQSGSFNTAHISMRGGDASECTSPRSFYEISSPRTPGSFGRNPTAQQNRQQAIAAATKRIAKQESFDSSDEEDGSDVQPPAASRWTVASPEPASVKRGSGSTGSGGRGRHRSPHGSDTLDDLNERSEDEADLVIEQLQSQLRINDDENSEDEHRLPDSDEEQRQHQEPEDEFDREYTSPSPSPKSSGSGGSSSAAPARRPLTIQVTRSSGQVSRNSLVSINTSKKSRGALIVDPSAASTSGPLSPRAPPPLQPSLRAKFLTTKQRCLRSMSSQDFQAIYQHFTEQHLLSPRGSISANMGPASPNPRCTSPEESRGLRAVREMLMHTSGPTAAAAISQELIFSVEQLVYLQQVLDRPSR